MKIVEWSIYEDLTTATKPPKGLECALTCNALALLYVASPSNPSESLLNADHADVRSVSTVRGKTVGALVVKILLASYLDPDWRFSFQYNEAAVISGELLPAQICSATCLDCEIQALSYSPVTDLIPLSEKILTRVPRGEAISGARAVYLVDDGGTVKAFRASATDPAKWAQGFVKEAGSLGDEVDVWEFCDLTGLSGISEGGAYFLGNSGEFVTAPPSGAAVLQRTGLGVSSSKVSASFHEPTFVS